MKTFAVIALVGTAVLMAAAGGYWYGGVRPPSDASAAREQSGAKAGPSNVSAKARPATLVEVASVEATSLPQTITAVGSLRSDESVTLRPEIAGRITAILFKEGQPVRKGDTLVRLDAAIPAADVRQARANVALAESRYRRSVELAARNFISAQAQDDARNNLEIAQAALALTEAKLAQTQIQAPFAGVIGLRVVSVGDYVKEGSDLVNLESIDMLKVDFRVPEVYLKEVQVGQAVEIVLDAVPGERYGGKVIALNPLIDAGGRAIVIRAQVSNRNTLLRPGMFARVTLITRSTRPTLMVPEEAIVPQGTEQFVFRVDGDKAVRIAVQTGQRRDGRVEIVNGISSGDVLVTAGQAQLRDGGTVRIVGAKLHKSAASSPVQPPAPAAATSANPERVQ